MLFLFLQDSSTEATNDPFTEELEDTEVTDRSDGPPTCQGSFASVGDGGDSEDDNVTVNTSTEEQRLKYAIVKSIFEAIELSTKTGAYLSTIAGLLCYARRMY